MSFRYRGGSHPSIRYRGSPIARYCGFHLYTIPTTIVFCNPIVYGDDDDYDRDDDDDGGDDDDDEDDDDDDDGDDNNGEDGELRRR